MTQHLSPCPVPPSHLSPSAPRSGPAHKGLSKDFSRDSEPQACSVSLGIQLHLSSKLLRHLGQTRKLPSKGPRPVRLPGDLGPRFLCVSFLLHQTDNLLLNYGVVATPPLPVLFLLRPHHDSRCLSNTDYVPCTGQRTKVDSVLTPLFNPGNSSLRLTDKETSHRVELNNVPKVLQSVSPFLNCYFVQSFLERRSQPRPRALAGGLVCNKKLGL